MPKSDIIVIGGSAGGLDVLKTVARGLRADLEAAVFVVLHIGGGHNGQSLLPQILDQIAPLPVLSPRDREPIQHGRIYVAPADYHLLLEPGYIRLSHGAKENLTRPAINPLFRSAAYSYGPRVAGVILTGTLDDGIAGLADIKQHGGVAIVQDPSTAAYPSMPLNAIEYVDVDHTVPVERIAGIIMEISNTDRPSPEKPEEIQRTQSDLTCPECRGPLWKERHGRALEYRCRVGHAFSPNIMEQEHERMVERTLWSALLAMEESAELAERIAATRGPEATETARVKRERAKEFRKFLGERIPKEVDEPVMQNR